MTTSFLDRAKRELRGLDIAEVQYEQRMLPCAVLMSQQAFYRWRDGYEDWLRTNHPDQVDRYRSDWRDGWTSAATAFQTFEAPLVELPRVDDNDSESIGRVCAIFEKLNSTGVDLSVYDLLTARGSTDVGHPPPRPLGGGMQVPSPVARVVGRKGR